MRWLTAFTLGLLTAVGGFLDIGDLVANSVIGSRFGMSLAWVVPVGVVGLMIFMEMSARVVATTGRGTFDLVRERLGARVGLANLLASYLITLLTLSAQMGGIALALELASGIHYLLWVPLVGVLVWIVLWRLPFEKMEKTYGLLGLALVVFGVALEAGLAASYSVTQYFGRRWGKSLPPVQAPYFHLVIMVSLLSGTLFILTGVDPVTVTEYSLVFSAAALPLTYLPILVVANDRAYLGERVNSLFTNVLASIYLVVVCVVSVASIPLMVYTKAGQ
ncbi:divalent metal cation transporter [Nocardiopsis alba]|uniref:divalent metal cation transporter n=1 Tax=Nocardiopsis alba TaxID=53437 RepID=UPI00366CBAF1